MAKPRQLKNVILDERFDEWSAEIERGVGRGLERAARAGAEAARSAPLRGYRAEGIVGDVIVTSARRGVKGIEVKIVWRDWRAIFFQFGTYQNRTKKTKRARRSGEAGAARGGVKALRFMNRAARAARAEMLDAIRAELR